MRKRRRIENDTPSKDMLSHVRTRNSGGCSIIHPSRRHILFMLRLILCLILLHTVSCDRIFEFMDEAETFYENSFEHADDAAGWYGITVEMFENDPAPGSGERCLGIGGGCIQPTATFTLPESESGGLYKLSCWGKVDEPYHGGSIRLVGGHRPVEFEIREHDWTFYETDTPVYCSAGKSMTIEILIGGYVADFMKLDAVRIIRE